MDRYICFSGDIPDELYRVDYPQNRRFFSSQDGFVAANTAATFGADELNDLKQAIEKHFKWGFWSPRSDEQESDWQQTVRLESGSR